MQQNEVNDKGERGDSDSPLSTIWTVPNLITFLRFLLVPVFWVMLLSQGPSWGVFGVFVFAACTDWIDGVIARGTRQVSKFGKLFDPLIDRLLIASGVLGACIVGRCPWWAAIVLVARDTTLFLLAVDLRKKGNGLTIPVFFAGKVTTVILLFGFSSLLADWPIWPGLAISSSPLLPGFGATPWAMGIWFVYIGVIFSVTTGAVYIERGIKAWRKYKSEH